MANPFHDAQTFQKVTHGAFRALLVAFALYTSACGGCGEEPEEEDRCAGVTCERGVCAAATGQCANASACEGDESLCLQGYACLDSGQCEAPFPCLDGACERGVCVEGACLNPESCQSDSACLPDSICEGELCVEDPCEGVTCERGVCARTSGECVNAATCTEASEATACTEGFKCSAQACVDEATFCAELDCQQGVCDFDAEACVDAPDCAGEDANCLAGRFCDEQNRCQQNVCLPTGSTCMGGGECVRATGECVNPQSCDEQSDCLPMNLCVSASDGSGPSCVLEAEACNDGASCPGNQVCTYDEPALTATCTEAGSCTTSFDCIENRVCSGGSCAPPGVCEDDALEPNNDEAVASDYLSAQQFGVVTANVCQGDVDVYTFDSSADPDDTGQNTLRVELRFAPEDLGLGSLKLELLDKDGDLVGEATASANTGYALIEEVVGILSTGLYQIRVSDEGGAGAVLSPGVRYTLFVDVVDQTVLSACAMPEVLAADTVATRSSLSGASTTLRSSCADRSGEAAEDIFQIEVEAASYLTIVADAAATADVAVSLRSACLSDQGELPGACSDTGGVDAVETINALVSAGTYFIVVQSDEADTGGSYTLTWSREEVVCTPAEDECEDVDTLRRCRATGQSFETVQCGASGCDMTLNRCNRPDGDVCDAVSPKIAKGDSPYTSAPIVWADLGGEYDPGVMTMGCAAANADGTSSADGAEITYEVRVPANHGLIATLSAEMSDDVSLYLVNDCSNLSACQAGVNAFGVGGTETLSWFNAEVTEQVVYLIADSKSGAMGQSTLSVEINDVICVAGTGGCTIDPVTGEPASGVCNATGTGYEGLTTCPLGCNAALGLCNDAPAETCVSAEPLTSGVTVSALIEQFEGDHNVDSSSSACSFTSTSGADAVYTIDAAAGDVIRADVQAPFDTVLWINGSCTSSGTSGLGQCLGVQNNSGTSGEVVQVVAQTAGTYYVAVAARSTSATGSFDLTVTTQQPNCMVGAPVACNATNTAVTFCNSFGVLEDIVCGGNGVCAAGACEQPSGDVCLDAIALTSGVAVTGDTSLFNSDQDVVGGVCPASTTSGNDAVYSITAEAGEVITAELTGASTTVDLWISQSCNTAAAPGGVDECLGVLNNLSSGSTNRKLQVVAPAQGTYYVTAAAAFSTNTPYTLTVSAEAVQCTPGQLLGCSTSAAGVLEYCDSFGLTETYDCELSCVGTSCDPRSGGICFDAVALNPQGEVSGVVQGDYGDFNNDLEFPAGISGACDVGTGDESDGFDAFYEIALAANDLIELDLDTTNSGGQIYILQDCLGLDSCLANKVPDGAGTLYFRAPTAGTYYVVVDSSFSTSTVDFTLTWQNFGNVLCVPNDASCNGATVEICDELGLSIASTYTCATGCTDGACDITVADADTCSTMGTPVTGGATYRLNYDDLSNNIDFDTPNCVGARTDGDDAFFLVEVGPNEVLTVTLESFNLSYQEGLIYIIEDCADPSGTCLAGGKQNAAENLTVGWVNPDPTPRTVVVGVDNESSTSSEDFFVQINIAPPACTPNDLSLTECIDATTVRYCNDLGEYESFTCAGNGVCQGTGPGSGCAQPSADVCVDAIALNPLGEQSGSVQGLYSDYQNDVQLPEGTTGACTISQGDASDGGDSFYEISLNAGEVVAFDLQTTDSGAQIYLFENCLLQSSCLVNDPIDGSGQLVFQVPTTATYYLMIDSSLSTASAAFTLNWNVIPGAICAPNTIRCSDPTTVAICDSSGLSETFSACTGSCTNGSCDFDATAADMCATAPVVTGGVFRFNYDDFGDEIDMSTPNCTSERTDGNDAFFSVTVGPGEVLAVETEHFDQTSYRETLLYIIEDCAAASATCLAGGKQYGPGSTASISWINPDPTPRTVIVGVDNESTFVQSDILVKVIVSPTDCVPSDPNATFCVNGQIEYCPASGLQATYACQGNGLCGVDGCDQPSGAICADSFPLNALGEMFGTIADSYAMATNDLTLPDVTTGACEVPSGDEPDGPEFFYSVDLSVGDLLDLNLSTSDSNAQIYVFENCLDVNTCVANKIPDGPGHLPYIAQQDGVHTVVVDSSSSSSTAPFVLDWEIVPNALCAPGDFFCLDPNTAAQCDADGLTASVASSCASGCVEGGCDIAAAQVDLCAMATPISGDTIYKINQGALSDDVDLPDTSCTKEQTDGADAFFTVTVPDNTALVVKTRNSDPASFRESIVYVFDSCDDPQTTCLDAAIQTSGSLDTELIWPNFTGAPADVVVAVDNESTTASGDVYVSFTTIPTECVPDGTATTTCINGDTLQYCGPDGLLETYLCGGNGVCNGSSCEQPQGDVCFDAIALTSGVSVSGDTTGFSSNNDVSGLMCTQRNSFGGDVVYSIDATAGQVISAEIVTASRDVTVWISDRCDSEARGVQGCLDSQFTDAGSARVIAPATGTYFIAVAGSSNFTQSTFDLRVTVEDPSCTPGLGSLVCDATSPGALAYCDEFGLPDTYTCEGSGVCTGTGCAQPQGDACVDALAINPMGEVAGMLTGSLDLDDASNSLELPEREFGNCYIEPNDRNDGADTFYSVDLAAGDVLELELTTTSTSSRKQLFVFSDCLVSETCLGNTSDSDGNLYSFQAPTAGTYYIVIDTSSTFTSSTFTLNWTITSGLTCAPNQIYCQDPNTAVQCNSTGTATLITTPCAFGCARGGCNVQESDVNRCELTSVDIGMGASLAIDLDGLSNTLNMSSPNCTGTETDGPDAFFLVTVPNNQTLTAGIVDSWVSGTPMIYLIEDCVTAASTDSCLVGEDDDNALITWTNTTGVDAQLILGVDNTIGNARGQITIAAGVTP